MTAVEGLWEHERIDIAVRNRELELCEQFKGSANCDGDSPGWP